MKIQQIKQYKTPSFTSTINIVGEDKYYSIVEKEPYHEVRNYLNMGGYTILNPETNSRAQVNGLSISSAYIVVNPKEVGRVSNDTFCPVELLNSPVVQSDKNTRALVIGGHEQTEDTYYKHIINKLNEDNVPTTYFVGQRGHVGINYSNVAYDLNEDKYYIAVYNDMSGKTVSNLNELINHFKNIFIADGDELFIKGKKVDMEVIKKLFKNFKLP